MGVETKLSLLQLIPKIMFPILFSILAVTSALPDPATLFESIAMPEPRGVEEQGIQGILQDQGVNLAEATFDATLARSACLARELCAYGAGEKARRNVNEDISVEEAMDTFTVFLSKIKNSAKRNTKNIDNLLGAVEVGKALGKNACNALYTCATPQGRVTCPAASNICPGLAMSCSMCGIFAPALCGASCTAAGLYCGVAGYSC